MNIRRRNRDFGLVSQVIDLDGKNAKHVSRRFVAMGGSGNGRFVSKPRKTKLYLSDVCSAGWNDHWGGGCTDEGISYANIGLTILIFHVLLSYLCLIAGGKLEESDAE